MYAWMVEACIGGGRLEDKQAVNTKNNGKITPPEGLFPHDLNMNYSFAGPDLIKIGEVDAPKLTKLHFPIYHRDGLRAPHQNRAQVCIGV
jgi:hypothetical protein